MHPPDRLRFEAFVRTSARQILSRRILAAEDLHAFRPWLHRLTELYVSCSIIGFALVWYGALLLVPAAAAAAWMLGCALALGAARRARDIHAEYLWSGALGVIAVLGWVAIVAAPVSSLVLFSTLVFMTLLIVTQNGQAGFVTLVAILCALYAIRTVQSAFNLDPNLAPSPQAWIEAGQVGVIFVVHFLVMAFLNDLIWHLIAQNRESNRQLLEAEAARTVFLASVTHELRTPLTGIRGYVDLMLAGKKGDQEALQIVRRNARRLESLIDELLNVADPMSLAERMEHDRMNLADVVREEAAALNGAPAYEPRARIEVRAPSEVWIRADRTRMEQVAVNLLTNALQHSPAGSPVAVSLEDTDEMTVLRVADQGSGMSKEMQARVFEPFFTTARAGGRHRGMGLGLTICRQIVNATGGSITIESEPGRGTTVTVTLPLSRQTLEAPQTATGRPRALVLDDDPDVCVLMRETLRIWGFDVDVANDGESALALAGDHAYAIFILDINVPKIRGTEVARKLRAAQCRGKIFLFSAISRRNAELAVADTQADGFIPKPFNLDSLAEKLRRAGVSVTV